MMSFLDLPSLVRRSTLWRVRRSDTIRTITMRHRAWLAERSPPRLRRLWVTSPEDASMGDDVGEGRFLAQPLGVVSGGDEQRADGVRAEAMSGDEIGGGGPHEGARMASRVSISSSRPWILRASCRSANLVAPTGVVGSPGRIRAAALTICQTVVSQNAARSGSGPVTTRARIWLMASVLLWPAERRTMRRARMASTFPVRVLGWARA